MNKEPNQDIHRLSEIVTLEFPPVNKHLLAIWRAEAHLPLLVKAIDEWIEVLDKKRAMIDMDTYDAAMKIINAASPATFAAGGTVGSVTDYFKNADLSHLPASAAVYIREQLLTDPALAEVPMDNETAGMVVSAIDSINTGYKEREVAPPPPVPINLDELEDTASQEAALAEKDLADDSLMQRAEITEQIESYQAAVKYAKGKEKKELEEAIGDLQTALKYLPEKKADGGSLTDNLLLPIGTKISVNYSLERHPKTLTLIEVVPLTEKDIADGLGPRSYHFKGGVYSEYYPETKLKKKMDAGELNIIGRRADGGFFDNTEAQIRAKFPQLTDADFDAYSTDLYVKYTPEVFAWIKEQHPYNKQVIKFTADDGSGEWIEIPFVAPKKEQGGSAGRKGFTASIYFKDEPNKIIEGYLFADGSDVAGNDEDIFYYVDKGETEMKALMDKDNGQDFVVVSYEPTELFKQGGAFDDNLLKTGGHVPQFSAWDFVERYYPNYYSSDEIAYNDDLHKIVDKEEQKGDAASKILKKEFNGDRKAAEQAMRESDASVYGDTIDAFIEETGKWASKEEFVKEFYNGHPEAGETHTVYEHAIDNYISRHPEEFKQGGRLKSAINRDRKYTSEQEWEKNYKRSGRRKFYKKDGGTLTRPYAQGYKTVDGVRIVADAEFDDNPLFYVWSEYPAYKKLDGNGRLIYSYEYYTDKDGNKYLIISDPNEVTDAMLTEMLAKADWNMARNVDTFVENADKEEYARWLELISKKGGSLQKISKGDLVFARGAGSRGLVGLVVSDKKTEEGEPGYDVYFRGYNGDVLFMPLNEIADILEGGHMDFASVQGDLMHYPNIAKKQGIALNPKYQAAMDEGDQDEYKEGGKLSAVEKAMQQQGFVEINTGGGMKAYQVETKHGNLTVTDEAALPKSFDANVSVILYSKDEDELIGSKEMQLSALLNQDLEEVAKAILSEHGSKKSPIIDWKDAEVGDSARVIAINKMGLILKPYGRKFHLKFVDDTEKTYDASELEFYKFEHFAQGGAASAPPKKERKPRKETPHILPATNFDIRISKKLATALFNKKSELLNSFDIMCKELGSGNDWAEIKSSDLSNYNIPTKYKTFEVWITSSDTQDQITEKLNNFITANKLR